MESKQAGTSREESAQAPLGDPPALPVPPLARPAIAEFQRQIAAANTALQNYLAGLVAGLGLSADQIAGIDLDTWTIRLRADRREVAERADGHQPGSTTPAG